MGLEGVVIVHTFSTKGRLCGCLYPWGGVREPYAATRQWDYVGKQSHPDPFLQGTQITGLLEIEDLVGYATGTRVQET